VDKDGYVYVTDVGRFQVVKFDRDGHFLAAVGQLGDNLGHFARPKGTALDRDGRLYTVDAAFNLVQVFSPLGRLLLFFGDGGNTPGGLVLPAKVVIDYANLPLFQSYVQPGFVPEFLILVTSQFGDRRVNVFAFGHDKGRKYPSDEELLKQVQERRRQEQEKLKRGAPSPSPSPSPSP